MSQVKSAWSAQSTRSTLPVMDEPHLPDGTIIETYTGDVLRTPHEAAIETSDYRLTAARNYLATAPASDFSRLLADVMSVADDFMATDLDETRTQVTIEGGVYLSPADVHRLCPACLSRATASATLSG
jgi:hypothetical protein